MSKALIATNVSTQAVKFKPGGTPASFHVTVVNESDQFATFQLEVLAPGAAEMESGSHWYTLSPEVCAKKPPGDSTEFFVVINSSPVPGFVGTMNLTVRVFSLELQQESRHSLRLGLEQAAGVIPLKVELPVRSFQAYPSDLVEITATVTNLGQEFAEAVIHCRGLDPAWLVEGGERRVALKPGSKAETSFLCQLPSAVQTVNRAYPFVIEATQRLGTSAGAKGTIDILPKGWVDFSCTPLEQQMPAKFGWVPQAIVSSATFKLKFENASNLIQEVGAGVKGEDQRKFKMKVVPSKKTLEPGATEELTLIMKKRRPWLGFRSQKYVFALNATTSDDRLDVRNDSQIVRLRVLPVLHPVVQILLLVLLLWLAWWLSWLNPNNPRFGHQAAVNSVQMSGASSAVISSSDDQRMIFWRTWGFRNPFVPPYVGDVGNAGKSVRVIRYKPLDNDLLAAGLENGEIQIWSALEEGKKPVLSFSNQKADRVFSLVFSRDSRYLFSGHGSGLVLLWDLQSNLLKRDFANRQPLLQKKMDFAVSSMALAGLRYNNLMIAGRYNQLRYWDLSTNQLNKLSYRQGGQDDYILSLSTAEYKPTLMAAADSQGYITLFDVSECLVNEVDCKVLDQWSTGHGGKPVRSLALSANACYLSSGGDDGRIMLWPLTPEGKRVPSVLGGKEIGTSFGRAGKINSVDIKLVNRNVYVVSGGDDKQVRLNVAKRMLNLGCDRLESAALSPSQRYAFHQP